VALAGANKEMIDLKVTEDSLHVEAKAVPREGKYLRREMSALGQKREIKLPVEIKPEQVRASFKDGILEVHLPKLVVVNAQTGAGRLGFRHFFCEHPEQTVIIKRKEE